MDSNKLIQICQKQAPISLDETICEQLGYFKPKIAIMHKHLLHVGHFTATKSNMLLKSVTCQFPIV